MTDPQFVPASDDRDDAPASYVLAMIQVAVPQDAADPADPNATVDAVRSVIGPKPNIFDVGYGAWGRLVTGSTVHPPTPHDPAGLSDIMSLVGEYGEVCAYGVDRDDAVTNDAEIAYEAVRHAVWEALAARPAAGPEASEIAVEAAARVIAHEMRYSGRYADASGEFIRDRALRVATMALAAARPSGTPSR